MKNASFWKTVGLASCLALVSSIMLHILHANEHEVVAIPVVLYWLRDIALALPMALAAILLLTPLTRVWLKRGGLASSGTLARLSWAFLAAFGYTLMSIPGIAMHLWLLGAARHAPFAPFGLYVARDATASLGASVIVLTLATFIVGSPWEWIGVRRSPSLMASAAARGDLARLRVLRRVPWNRRLGALAVSASIIIYVLPTIVFPPSAGAVAASCTRTLTASVVALDQPLWYNRLGTHNSGGMMFALARDVVVKSGANAGTPVSQLQNPGSVAGNVMLRADKRPRPIVLRANVGDCLQITFTNLLAPTRVTPDQPADRFAGIHVNGVQLVDPDGAGPLSGIDSDGSNVGRNASSLAAPGGTKVYKLYAEHENTYMLSSLGVTVGSEATGGTLGFGLFGALNVEPFGTDWYRSQLTRVEMDMAAAAWTGNDTVGWTAATYPQVGADGKLAIRLTPDGQPVINYDARYPVNAAVPGFDANKADLPIMRMLTGANEEVHTDLNAIIAGPASAGYRIPERAYPLSYWANQVFNMNENRGAEPFREFTTIFHDEIATVQAFPDKFADPKLTDALHSVRDGFAINYGTGGIGAEILGNRLGVGPMWNCVDCKFEEFFLTAWAVGDPAEVVDLPADQTLAAGGPGAKTCVNCRATKVLYPDDPSNVHHSYMNDRVKFRNINVGPKEHHIFHLHSHQWTFMPNTASSAYLDSQGIGPGSGYTYEIANGGTGNRNKVVGDSIFHCHFYPHFAGGMWELWRSHDTFERGTVVDANGVPVAGSRALPDGEIVAGTPIPGLVPLPGRPMAPMPNAATKVVPFDLNGDGVVDSSQVDADGNGIADVAERDANGNAFGNAAPAVNPGFPFMIPGVAGHRAPTPALDSAVDGGLPRLVVLGGTAVHFETPLDFNKTLTTLKVGYIPETGTPTEQVAMQFHEALFHPTYLSDGNLGPNVTRIDTTHPVAADAVWNGTAWVGVDHQNPTTGATFPSRPLKGFETNGLPRANGAPFAEPCRTDPRWDSTNNVWVDPQPVAVNRTYKAAGVQIDATINKVGYHFPQERILALNDDVGATINGTRAPEPLVMRLDVNDCATYEHTNLIPNTYQLDDFEVRTPTDIIGQHIHLVKFDVTASDGSSNGFNYEDGTISPQEVQERINAIRAFNNCGTSGDANGNGLLDAGDTWTATCPLAKLHPFFGGVLGSAPTSMAWGARTTIQKWYADPLLNQSWDQSLGTVFTHDHFGPSTHQQVGLYATVLIEPEATKWRDSDTGALFGAREDGGPTSWRADIYWDPASDPRNANAYREFYLEFADFQHAYQKGGGALHTQDNGSGVQIPSYADFKNAINPSLKQKPPSGSEQSLFFFPGVCKNGLPRPCPEVISADDVGTFVVNYRNEPGGLRVYDPSTGTQATGARGDLARVFESRTDRAIAALNSQPAVYPDLTADVGGGDPYTPMLRTYMGDKVRLRVQVGATEETHNVTVEGVKWHQDALDPNSGWRNTQTTGISEYFNLEMPIPLDTGPGAPTRVDYLYTMGASLDDLWNGDWGVMRSYRAARNDLQLLPNNQIPSTGWTITNSADFQKNSVCPTTAPARSYDITAVRAADVLGANGIVYNTRTTAVVDSTGATQGAGPLIDPTALLYVNTADLVKDSTGKPIGLKPGTPVKPIVLRAAAGDCITVTLRNKLPSVIPELPGFNAVPPIIHKNENVLDPLNPNNPGIITFNFNDLKPSNLIGLGSQLVAMNRRQDDGLIVGTTAPSLVAPGGSKDYTWYAGAIDTQLVTGGVKLTPRPVEFGGANLMPADRLTGSNNGLIGALIIEPQGATWTIDAGSNVQATVTWTDSSNVSHSFREFATLLQDDLNLRYAGSCTPTAANLQCAVPDIGSQQGYPEDAEDSGQKAINYGADPLWFRLGLSPDVPFSDPHLRDNTNVHQLYSNSLVGGDPQTQVFTADPNGPTQVRIRLLEPGGHARGHVFTLNGNAWQREPYVQNSDRIAWAVRDDPTTLNTPTPDGVNDVSWWVSSQEGVGPSTHFEIVLPFAGGRFGATGDYLFRDSAAFGNYNGLWGIYRFNTP